MLKNRGTFAILSLLFSMPCWSSSGFYLGFGLGPETVNFKQNARITEPGNSDTIDKTIHGGKGAFGSIFAGYDLDLQRANPKLENLNLALEANANISSVKFKSSNSELIHSNFNYAFYKLRRSFGLSLLPGFYIAPCALLYARLGYALGNFTLETTEITLPNTRKNLGGIRYGLGIKQDLNKKFSLRLEYSRISYQQKTLLGLDPASNVSKKTTITPETSVFEVGLVYRF